jgi:hypothetical protein
VPDTDEYDVLLVALGRVSRDHATLVGLERRLDRHGVRVVSVAEENGDGVWRSSSAASSRSSLSSSER